MPDLESSIATWRQQMLAAGIQSPVPLEELEIHLREEIERQLKTGATGQHAFEAAIAQMGMAATLKTEFKKAAGFAGWMAEYKYNILGLLWWASGTVGIYRFAAGLAPVFYVSNSKLIPHSFSETACMIGAVHGMLLLAGHMRARPSLRLLACLAALNGVAGVILQPLSLLTCFFTAFCLVSIWLLRPPQKLEKTAN
jgi:hypothetical protein